MTENHVQTQYGRDGKSSVSSPTITEVLDALTSALSNRNAEKDAQEALSWAGWLERDAKLLRELAENTHG